MGNEAITHGLHWLTRNTDGWWECAHPVCIWNADEEVFNQTSAQRIFDEYHIKLSEAEASVQP